MFLGAEYSSRKSRPIKWDDDYIIKVDKEGPELKGIVDSFMIFLNGSLVGLWDCYGNIKKDGKVVNGQWLVDTLVDVWDIVRDSFFVARSAI